MKRKINQNTGHQPIQSSTIRSAGYDKKSGDLHVTFQDGGKYVYHGVTPDKYEAFQMAASKGSWLHHNLKGQHEFTKL
jgi:hypothetical protein